MIRIHEPANPLHKVHTRYKTCTGVPVPGVTTVLGVLNKPALVPWAHKLGLEGIDYRKFRDEKADIGSLAHYLVACDLTNIKPDGEILNALSPRVVDMAENSLLSFLEWKKHKTIEVYGSEIPLVSAAYLFGGTIDVFCSIDGVPVVLDLKTGKGIYDNYFIQLSAYFHLLEEYATQEGFPLPEYGTILNIPRSEDERFMQRSEAAQELRVAFTEVFTPALRIFTGLKILDWRL